MVEVWHNSDDVCGEPCDETMQLLADLAAEAPSFARSRVTVEPHFIFSALPTPCSDDDAVCLASCYRGRCRHTNARVVCMRARAGKEYHSGQQPCVGIGEHAGAKASACSRAPGEMLQVLQDESR